MFGDIVSMITDDQVLDIANRCKNRRDALLDLIAQQYPDKSGTVLLLAPLEMGHYKFLQESSFYYFSGISEPAMALMFSKNQPTTLYQPDFGSLRAKWVHSVDVINEQTKVLYGIDELQSLGKPVAGYQVDPYFPALDYQNLIDHLSEMVINKKTIFTLYPVHSSSYGSVKMVLDRLALFVPNLMNHVVDVSNLVAKLRKKKDMAEIEMMYQAVAITQAAFQAAAHVIKPGATEAQVQAAMEYIFTEQGATPAYSSIVAGAVRATILHYHTNNMTLNKGDLVLIDAGARYGHYCADITRVFPVSGTFSKEQKKLYEIVLATQEHVASFAKPGMWISNAEQQDMSLQHIAINFLKKYGYDQYFIHGIGHHLGLDVHDVPSRSAQLEAGDVITIESGVYIPEQSIGIRIEDNYWIVADDEPVCLSEDIPKSVRDVENMVKQSF